MLPGPPQRDPAARATLERERRVQHAATLRALPASGGCGYQTAVTVRASKLAQNYLVVERASLAAVLGDTFENGFEGSEQGMVVHHREEREVSGAQPER